MKTLAQKIFDNSLLVLIGLSLVFMILSVLINEVAALARIIPVQLLPISFMLMLATLIFSSFKFSK